MRSLLALLLLTEAASADVHVFDGPPCKGLPNCHRVTSSGKFELYSGADPAVVKSGEYRLRYVLALPDKHVTDILVAGGQPSTHAGEMCRSKTEWCDRIVDSTPKLTVDKTGATLVVVTNVHVQTLISEDHNDTKQVNETQALTVHCAKQSETWDCTEVYETPKQALEAYRASVEKMDIDATAALLETDAQIHHADQPATIGRDKIKAFLQTFAKYKVTGYKLEADTSTASGTTVKQHGTYHQDVTDPDGKALKVDGEFDAEWHLDSDGHWRIARMHTNNR